MKKLNLEIFKNKRLVIYIAAGIIVAVIDIVVLVGPGIFSLKKKSPEVKEARTRLNTAQGAIGNMQNYKKTIEGLRNQLFSSKKSFSKKEEISVLLKWLSETAEKTGVKIISVKPHVPVAATASDAYAGFYQKLPISVNASCGYHQLGMFLNKLENADIFMRVADLRIEGTDEAEQKVSMVINTYITMEQR